MKNNKFKVNKISLIKTKAAVFSVIGFILLFIGIIGLVAIVLSPADEASTTAIIVVMFAAPLIGGGVLLYKAFMAKKAAVRYTYYINLVVNQGVESIDQIAAETSSSYDATVNNLQKAINDGCLKDVLIDKTQRKITLKKPDSTPHPTTTQAAPGGLPINVQSKSVRCPGCGANNVVTTGKATECEYCATIITG